MKNKTSPVSRLSHTHLLDPDTVSATQALLNIPILQVEALLA